MPEVCARGLALGAYEERGMGPPAAGRWRTAPCMSLGPRGGPLQRASEAIHGGPSQPRFRVLSDEVGDISAFFRDRPYRSGRVIARLDPGCYILKGGMV